MAATHRYSIDVLTWLLRSHDVQRDVADAFRRVWESLVRDTAAMGNERDSVVSDSDDETKEPVDERLLTHGENRKRFAHVPQALPHRHIHPPVVGHEIQRHQERQQHASERRIVAEVRRGGLAVSERVDHQLRLAAHTRGCIAAVLVAPVRLEVALLEDVVPAGPMQAGPGYVLVVVGAVDQLPPGGTGLLLVLDQQIIDREIGWHRLLEPTVDQRLPAAAGM